MLLPRIKRFNTNASTDEVMGVTAKNSEFLLSLNRTVKRFLDENARRWVDMQNLFSFMKIS